MRLLNPTKPEIGRISKRLTERIVREVKGKTKYNQWKSTDSVIQWFSNLTQKHTLKFLQFDVVNFYPSITRKLLLKVITWAKEYTNISEEDIKIIFQAKKSVLHSQKSIWTKKGDSEFDVTMGSYDGAETCELVGLYILSLLEPLGVNAGLYRDDGLLVTRSGPRQAQKLGENIQKIFNDCDLKITFDANLTTVNFLDTTLDLRLGTYKPYTKPNETKQYVHKQSNHPPNILKNIPDSVNKRLSKLSSTEAIFNEAAEPYQKALEESGYEYKLKYKPQTQTQNKRKRKRNITWFNPPFSSSVSTKIGAKFLSLIDKHFPKGNPLNKTINRNTVKVSYKTVTNMKKIIGGHNAKVLKDDEEKSKTEDKTEKKECNCRKKEDCPLDGKCLSESVIYQAEVTETISKQKETYVGLTGNTFKERFGTHKSSFEHENQKGKTTLSMHLWELKKEKKHFKVKWKVIDKAKTYNPTTKKCNLCLKEKFYIIFKPELGSLNKRNELGAACRHKKRLILGTSRPPGGPIDQPRTPGV